jgi:glycosyltransferase involved in cell wall biosynthesis
MVTFIFRKKLPSGFSIEKIFDVLYAHFRQAGCAVARLELPHVSSGVGNVLKNAWFVARRRRRGILHITGDVHYAAIFRPFVPTVVTIHDCVVLQRGTGFKRFVLWLFWFGLPLRLASAITVISQQTKDEVLEVVGIPDGKVSVIPNFVDPAFSFVPKDFDGARPRILHIGTTPNKNLLRVIGALHGVPCCLVIVGQLPEAALGELRQRGVHYEHHFAIDHDAMRRLYLESDIISFPSTYEGFGMPILEGQAVGRPVLTSNIEPMRGVAGDGGALLVDPHSEAAIRDGFLALMGDAALRARLVAAGQDNCRRYSLDAIAAMYGALYRRLEGS